MPAAGGDTLVLQSHRLPLPGRWLEPCLASVRAWAAGRGFAYRFEGDELLHRLPDDLRARTSGQTAIAADLARLSALGEALDAGYRRAVWIDADTLVIDPTRLNLPATDYALGREVWIQPAGARGRLRAYVKVHNAFLLFAAGNPFLSFYRHAAERIVRAHQGPMVPQLVGPKLLTALHNLIECPVAESAGMLSPAVARDLVAGGGPALDLFLARSPVPPAALNLCGSLVGREFSAQDMVTLVEALRARGVGATQHPRQALSDRS